MKLRKIFLTALFLFLFLVILAIAKPAFAMAPPPASNIWLWKWLQSQEPPTSQMVKVIVEWQEGARTESVELKTILKDVR